MAGAHEGAQEVSQDPHDDGALQGAEQQEEEQADASHGDEQHEEELLCEQRPAKADCAVMANTTIAEKRFFCIGYILQS